MSEFNVEDSDASIDENDDVGTNSWITEKRIQNDDYEYDVFNLTIFSFHPIQLNDQETLNEQLCSLSSLATQSLVNRYVRMHITTCLEY
jgi:hypothetical protein